MEDASIVIPRNASVEANQSGLIMETIIDITPKIPIPEYEYGPLHPQCGEEKAVVCNRDRIMGETGYSIDALVAVCTKLAREMDSHGMDKVLAIGD
eukprot:gene31710-39970_t